MTQDMTKEQKNSALLMSLIMNFQTGAMQAMGKIKNPVTDKIEFSLEQASMYIDMVDMLLEKTKGNLSAEESAFVSKILAELKMNYVNVKKNN